MKIRAMIIDEAEDSRRRLSEILESEHSIEVVCKLGDEAGIGEMAGWVAPDVILIKVGMCKKGGPALFDAVLKKKTPLIVMGNGREDECTQLVELLGKGAVDFLILPGGKKEIVEKVKNAAMATPVDLKDRLSVIKFRFPKPAELRKLIVIASSTGGPQALRRIIPRIPKNLPAAIIIVQHMGRGFTAQLAKSLGKISDIKVKEAQDGEPLVKGVAYVAPYGLHLFVEDGKITLKEGPPKHGVTPSADYAMKSAAEAYGMDSIGVVLTGMGKDGAIGIKEIKNAGGRTIVQDRKTSVVFRMPQEALKTGRVDKVVELERISEVLVQEVCKLYE